MRAILSIISLLVLFNANAKAIETEMVIATVNEDAITLQELKNRITLSKLLIQRKLTALEFNAIKEQALEQLIAEKLKQKYAEKNKITIKPEELKFAISIIEKQRGLAEGSLMKNLPEKLKETALNQIKDSVLQQKIIRERIIPRIRVDQYKIDKLLENAIALNESREYNISQIIIKQEQKINKIYQKLKAGEKFKDLVQIYSEDDLNKAKGGNLGWFALEELNLTIRKNVQKLKVGEFSEPIKSEKGWYIIMLDDYRFQQNLDTATYNEYKIDTFNVINIDENSLKELNQMANKVNGYTAYKQFKKDFISKFNGQLSDDAGYVKQDDLPKDIKTLIKDVKPSNFSVITSSFKGDCKFVYIVDKKLRRSKQIEQIHDRIKRNLQNSQAERKLRQLLIKLRDEAYVDLR